VEGAPRDTPLTPPSPPTHTHTPTPSSPRRIVNTFFTVFELVGDSLISWLPLYWEAKVAFVVWLTLAGGAGRLYNSLVRLLLERYEHAIDAHVSSLQSAAAERVNDVAAQGLQQVRSRSTQIAALGLQWLGSVNAMGQGGPAALTNGGGGSAAGATAPAGPAVGGPAGQGEARKAK
jgi:hypothetical protein